MTVLEGTVPWPDDLARQYAAGWWRGQDLGAEFAAVAAARPDATALVDGAPGSATRDCSPGPTRWPPGWPGSGCARDRIVVQLPNCWQFVVLTLRLPAAPGSSR